MIKRFILKKLLPFRERYWVIVTFEDHTTDEWPEDVRKYHYDRCAKLREQERRNEGRKK